ncbi:hypothetical protein BDR26DRAFT_318517 [Obelidium mucronatum]|nr:hypothetical protein BDR26DRAFT_318517 [Obelidium mucronatum]
MERQQTAGKTWFRVASYVNKVHGTEILSPMIHTSHDQMESKALNCIRLPSVKCADTRVETCDEWKAQIQRFLYGDLAVWQSAWIDNNWLIRGYRYFMRLPQGLYAARSYAEYLILLNPSDFAFTDVDFLVYLIVTLLVPGRPPNWLQPYVVYTIVGTSVIIIPLFIAPVVFHAKAKGLSLITTLSSLLASISLLLQSSFIVLPLVVLKPIMPTGWTKKAPGLWADLFVSACGLFLMACLSQWWAFSNMFTFVLCQPISLPWLLWGVLTKPLFLGTTSRKEEKDEEKLIVDLSLRDRIL